MITIKKEEIPSLAKVEDLIICRCFYPLVPVYFQLLMEGIPAKMGNAEIGEQLKNIIEQIGWQGGREYSTEEFRQVVTKWYYNQKEEMLKAAIEMRVIAGLHDKIQALNAIYRGSKARSIGELTQFINQMSNKSTLVVKLTTIHGAKGLEANRVFLLRPDLLPHPKATQSWEKEQEANLEFVALTRSKQTLFLAN